MLCRAARGDLIALLDADDVWHPKHLEITCRLFGDHPDAAVFFVGQRNVVGHETFEWDLSQTDYGQYTPEIIDSITFFKRYNKTPGLFYPSVCSFARRVLKDLGDEPFKTAAEDAYFLYSAILTGVAVYVPICLTAIRVLEGSLSSNRLKVYGGQVQAFELLRERYESVGNHRFTSIFRNEFAGARRQYAKRLMGAGRFAEARRELWLSLESLTLVDH